MIAKHPLTWVILALIAMFGVAGVLGDRRHRPTDQGNVQGAGNMGSNTRMLRAACDSC